MSNRTWLMVTLCAAFCLGGRAGAAGPASEKRASPSEVYRPSPWPKYEFDGPTVKLAEYDDDDNRKPDRWCHYEKGKLVLCEYDLDGDGRADLRIRPGGWPNGLVWTGLEAVKMAGEYRFVPVNFTPCNPNGPPFPLGEAERLIDGKWTGTFELKKTYRVGGWDDDGLVTTDTVARFAGGRLTSWEAVGKRDPARSSDFTEHRDGRLVRGILGPAYVFTEYRDGRPSRKVSGPARDRIASTETFLPNGWLKREEEDRDGDGKVDWIADHDQENPARFKVSRLIDGKWADTFETTGETSQLGGRSFLQHLFYRKGYIEREEWRQVGGEPGKGNPGRKLYKEGWLVLWERDRDGDGVVDIKTRYEPPEDCSGAETQRLKDGKWEKDFIDELPTSRCVYRRGWLARVEYFDKPGEGRRMTQLIVYVSPTEHHFGADGRISNWYYYSSGPSRRIVREKRDINGDGQPDLDIDYEKLTIRRINRTPPAAGR